MNNSPWSSSRGVTVGATTSHPIYVLVSHVYVKPPREDVNIFPRQKSLEMVDIWKKMKTKKSWFEQKS